MTDSVARLYRLFGGKKLTLREKYRLKTFYNTVLERLFGILMEKKEKDGGIIKSFSLCLAHQILPG